MGQTPHGLDCGEFAISANASYSETEVILAVNWFQENFS